MACYVTEEGFKDSEFQVCDQSENQYYLFHYHDINRLTCLVHKSSRMVSCVHLKFTFHFKVLVYLVSITFFVPYDSKVQNLEYPLKGNLLRTYQILFK